MASPLRSRDYGKQTSSVVCVVKAVPSSRVRPAVKTSPVAPAKRPVPLRMRPIPENVPVPVPCGCAGSKTDTSLIVTVAIWRREGRDTTDDEPSRRVVGNGLERERLEEEGPAETMVTLDALACRAETDRARATGSR